jgi:hypothetical protein
MFVLSEVRPGQLFRGLEDLCLWRLLVAMKMMVCARFKGFGLVELAVCCWTYYQFWGPIRFSGTPVS